jgi:cation:H+ antiporter
MISVVFQFVFFAALIVGAGSFLSRYADEIAEITGFGRMLIGSVLLASATSLPELSVDIACIRQGNPDLAVGDLLGSSLMNLLILAVLDLTHRSRGKIFSRAASGHALGGAACIALTAIVAVSLLVERQTGGRELTGLGIGSMAVMLAYVLSIRMIFLDQRIAARTSAEESVRSGETGTAPSLVKPVVFFLLAAVVIVLAGPRLSAAADELAVLSGLEMTFVGTTLIALSTSLPELVTCWAAVRLGSIDLAIGNIFGSNAFNMLILAGLDFAQPGSLMSVVSPLHCITAIFAILATSVTIMGQLYHVEKRCWLVEPDALVVILIVFGSLGLVYVLPS